MSLMVVALTFAQSSAVARAEASGADIGWVDTCLGEQVGRQMPQGIGDVFRFDVTGTPCPIAKILIGVELPHFAALLPHFG